jgi:glycine/D-amino acid oxidase-like deaminating enzyme
VRGNVSTDKRIEIDSRTVARDEAKILEPQLDVGDFSTIGYEPQSRHADPSLTVSSLGKSAQKFRVTFLTRTGVTKITKLGGLKRRCSVETSDDLIHVD